MTHFLRNADVTYGVKNILELKNIVKKIKESYLTNSAR